MEDAKSTDEDDDFFEASDEFPFYDCPEAYESTDDSISYPQSTISLSSSPNPDPVHFPAVGGYRRCRSVVLGERNRTFYRDLRDIERGSGKVDSDRVETTSESIVDGVNVDRNERSEEDLPPVGENNDGQYGLLVSLAELIVKAIGFQLNLVFSFVTFPFWVLYYSCMLVVNPFHVLGRGRVYLIRKIMRLCNLVCGSVSLFVSEWLKEHKWLLKLALRIGWGMFWSVSVCSILVTLLMSAFVISGLMTRYYLVEHPFQLKQALNFDYTENSPVAFVPITVCPTIGRVKKNEFGNARDGRVLPLNHKLQATVTLILPESNYNQNLGMFQVRVDFLSGNGKTLASLSHPCILEFRSHPIRLLSTFFKIIPLVSGYLSESQTLHLKFKARDEGVNPTACLKVTIEQRAEFRPKAGIPEVYNAFLHVESELPFLKRILWHWRKTFFVWLSMMLFVLEVLSAFLCCGPFTLPRARFTRTRGNASRNGSQTSHQVQR